MSKALTPDEISSLMGAGLSVFPIYQDGGEKKSHFVESQGYKDAQRAIEAALRCGFTKGTVIYFAVDSDMYEYEINSFVARYFREIRLFFNSNSNLRKYRVGVYGTRLLCTRMHELGYTDLSFVGDLSTGFAGNLGYPLPKNWAFDQFREFDSSKGEYSFDLDRDSYSGRDKGSQEFFPMPYVKISDGSKDTSETLRQEYAQKFFEALGMSQRLLGVEWTVGAEFPIANLNAQGLKIEVYGEIADSVSHNGVFSQKYAISQNLKTGKVSQQLKDAITSRIAESGLTAELNSDVLFSALDSLSLAFPDGKLTYSMTATPTSMDIAVTEDFFSMGSDENTIDAEMSLSVIFRITFSQYTVNMAQIPEWLKEASTEAVAAIASVLECVKSSIADTAEVTAALAGAVGLVALFVKVLSVLVPVAVAVA